MKRLMLFLALIGMALCQPGPCGAVTLYDDFGTDYFKKSLWTDFELNGNYKHEFVREIDGGVLVLKLGTNEETYPQRQGVRLSSPIADGLTKLTADVRIVKMNNDRPTDSATVFGRLAGFFYNDTHTDPPPPSGCFEGLIHAELALGDRGNGLEAWWEIERFHGCEISEATIIAQGSLTLGPPQTTLVEGNWYTMEIDYDGGTGFTFSITDGAGIDLDAPASGPTRVGSPQFDFGAFQACVHKSPGEWLDGYVHAEFDNVLVNGAPYDSFDGDLIDQGLWRDREYVRDSTGMVARLEVNSANEGRPRNQLFLRDRYTPYHEATATLDGTSVLYNGAVGRVRISGIYYNRVHGPGSYDGYVGDVFAQVGLQQDSAGRRSAVWRLFQFTNAEATAWTNFAGGTLPTTIVADTPYLLSITWTGTGLTFKCGSDDLHYDISGTNNAPYGPDRRVASILFLDPSESGFIKGTFDNVGVADPAYTNLTDDWTGSITNNVVTAGGCGADGDSLFDISIAQTHTELEISNELDELAAYGVISGSRVLLTHISELDGDELIESWADMTMSNSWHMSGDVWTKSTDGCEQEGDIAFTRANDNPTADDQTLSVAEDSTDTVITLTGDDPNGDSITFAVASGPTNGSLTGTAPDMRYTPDANYHGLDSFTFTVDDGRGGTATGTVSITVTPANDDPQCDDQSVRVGVDSSDNVITLSGDDPDDDSLTFAVLTDPANGTLSGTAPDLLYTPNADFEGSDSFTFSVEDGNGGSDTGTVTITVSSSSGGGGGGGGCFIQSLLF